MSDVTVIDNEKSRGDDLSKSILRIIDGTFFIKHLVTLLIQGKLFHSILFLL
jgi:hypothetical protein